MSGKGGSPAVILLGANRSHWLTARALERAGFNAIGVNALDDPIVESGFGEWWEVDPTDASALLERIRKIDSPQALLTATEGEALAAIELAEACGLSFPAPWPSDKWIQRQTLNAIPGLHVNARLVSGKEEILALFTPERREWIIKPRASRGGSRGVYLARKASDVFRQTNAREHGIVPMVAEEVLDGPQLTIDAVVHHGESRVLGVGRNVKQTGANQVNVAIVWDDQSGEHVQSAQRLVQDIADHLRIRHGLLHIEAAATEQGLRPIEVAHRQGGGVVPDAVALACGQHPVITAVAPQREPATNGKAAVVIVYLIAPPARLAPQDEQPDLAALRETPFPGVADLMVFLPKNSRVPVLADTSARLGHVLAYGDTAEEAVARAMTAAQSFTLLREDGEACPLLFPSFD